MDAKIIDDKIFIFIMLFELILLLIAEIVTYNRNKYKDIKQYYICFKINYLNRIKNFSILLFINIQLAILLIFSFLAYKKSNDHDYLLLPIPLLIYLIFMLFTIIYIWIILNMRYIFQKFYLSWS